MDEEAKALLGPEVTGQEDTEESDSGTPEFTVEAVMGSSTKHQGRRGGGPT